MSRVLISGDSCLRSSDDFGQGCHPLSQGHRCTSTLQAPDPYQVPALSSCSLSRERLGEIWTLRSCSTFKVPVNCG